MNTKAIESQFALIGARLKVRQIPSQWSSWDRRMRPENFAMDIQRDGRGPFFEFRIPENLRDSLEATVMQSEPKQRHLLLLVRQTLATPKLDRFLCGHDERDWFVAAVPGGASSVRQAMVALQPAEVRQALAQHLVSSQKRFARKNRAFRRQGEWFFVPEPRLVVDDRLILRHEPLRRGGGKPHFVEQLYRTGGETVHVCRQYPNGVTPEVYHSILQRDRRAAGWGWQLMRRNPGVYARGTVRHSDHDTIVLPFWHRVLMNTETQSRTMAHVAFLD
jgi:hypothetical protein